MKIAKYINRSLSVMGLEIRKKPVLQPAPLYPADFTEKIIEIYETIKPFTMTSRDRVCSLVQAVDYILKNNIPGDFVECGVWKGGSSMAMALACLKEKVSDRHLYLYDTFSGMSEPTEHDISYSGLNAMEKYIEKKYDDQVCDWCYSSLENVKKNLDSTSYPKEKIHFQVGKVEETLPNCKHSSIALLRLDTDWYESTKIELEILFPKLSKGGILIIDDYGSWDGAKKAVDEYFTNYPSPVFLSRIDRSGRLVVKNL
jgi:O-methyltransferase